MRAPYSRANYAGTTTFFNQRLLENPDKRSQDHSAKHRRANIPAGLFRRAIDPDRRQQTKNKCKRRQHQRTDLLHELMFALARSGNSLLRRTVHF